MTTWQILGSIGVAYVCLSVLGLWWFSVIARSRKVDPVYNFQNGSADYRVAGLTEGGFDFKIGFNLLDPDDYGLHDNAVSYIKCWALLKRAKVEMIIDTKTGKTIYFRDLG